MIPIEITAFDEQSQIEQLEWTGTYEECVVSLKLWWWGKFKEAFMFDRCLSHRVTVEGKNYKLVKKTWIRKEHYITVHYPKMGYEPHKIVVEAIK